MKISVTTLLQGDCIELMCSIPDASIDLIATDPPYRTITGGRTHGNRPKGVLSNNDGLFEHQTDIGIQDWMPQLYRVLKDGSHCYVFSNVINLKDMLIESEKCGFKLHNLLVWQKNNCTPSQYYMKNCEYILFLRKGKAKWINDIGGSKTVLSYNNILGKKNHPTEKPVDLMQKIILNSSKENEIVLDPFMSSGSTGVACVNTNRQFIGMELDENYFNLAKKRIEESEHALEEE